jgi:hypothetical protein
MNVKQLISKLKVAFFFPFESQQQQQQQQSL